MATTEKAFSPGVGLRDPRAGDSAEFSGGSRAAMKIRDAAREFLAMGLRPVPLQPGAKYPALDKWPELRATDADIDALFSDDGNIGIILGDGIVDVDLDSPEAVALADDFLPPTDFEWGRKSKPRSHRLYRVGEDAPARTVLGDGGVIVELRGKSHQTAVPPSTHPSGEAISFTRGLPSAAAAVALSDLSRSVRLLAVACVLARRWPATRRNDTALAAAGLMCKSLATRDEAKKVLAAVVAHVATPERDRRARAIGTVDHTYDKWERKEAITGGPTLADLVQGDGREAVAKIREFLGVAETRKEQIERDDKLEWLNTRYFIVDVGTETVVGEEVAQQDDEGGRRWTELAFRSFADFRNKLIKETVPACAKRRGAWEWDRKPLADQWLRSKRNGRQYERLVYAPPGSGVAKQPNDLDGWRGFTVEPMAGDWPLTRAFVRDIICGGDAKHDAFVMDFLAALFRYPGRRAETALVLVGGQGEGKNFFADHVIGGCFDGRHARTVRSANQALGEFNDVLSGLCWLVLDEVTLTKPQAEQLKSLVTSDSLDINRKGIPIAKERSMLHVAALSNSERPIPLDPDDRRYAFLHVSKARKYDAAYFGKLAAELRNGGRAAMLAELLDRTVDHDALRLAPVSAAKRRARRANWPDATAFLFHEIRECAGEWPAKPGNNGNMERRVNKDLFVARFRTWLYQANVRRDMRDLKDELAEAIRRHSPPAFQYNRAVKSNGAVTRDYWTLPAIDDFRASFAKAAGIEPRDFDEPTFVEEDAAVVGGF